MKKFATPLLAVLTFLTACQKEAALVDPGNSSGGGGTTTGGLLTRNVETDGTDSTVTDFSYGAGNRLTKIDYTGSSASPATYKLSRNNSGVITRMTLISPDFQSIGVDSIVINVSYNSSTSRYTSSQYSLAISGTTYTDSTAYVYDASGNLTSAAGYEKIAITPYTPYGRTDYTYANGNVSSEKYYDYDPSTSTWSLSATSAYTYDAKTNPLKLGVEAILLNQAGFFGPNNSTDFSYKDATDPTNNFTRTYTYTYNSANKPSGGTAVENPGATSYTLRFFYN